MSKISSLYFPYTIVLLTLFNSVLNHFVFSYIYAIFILINMLLLMRNLRFRTTFFPVYLYIFTIFIIFIVQLLVIEEEQAKIVRSFFVYITAILYWVFYFQKFGESHFRQLVVKITPLVYVIAALGCMQFFLNTNLWGLLPLNFDALIWSHAQDFSYYATFFRVSSTLGSAQVYGLFVALYIVVILSLDQKQLEGWRLCGILFLFVSGLLSGNKSFIATLLLFFFYILFVKKDKKTFVYILAIISFSFGLLLILGDNVVQNIRPLERLVNIQTSVDQEASGIRWHIYRDIVLNTDFIGNGFGSHSLPGVRDYDTKVAESYIFQILGEAGPIALIIFCFMLICAYTRASRLSMPYIRILLIAMYFSMLIIQAFNSPVFFIFWGFIILPYCADNKNYKFSSHNIR